MVYYTERNGMRKPIERTYDISTDKYALLLDCCEKYYNNLASSRSSVPTVGAAAALMRRSLTDP